MKENDLLEIALWWIIVIMAIIAYITLFGGIIYLAWLLLPLHWIFKVLIMLFIIAILMISISSLICGYYEEN